MDSWQQLQAFLSEKDESAFRAIVDHYTPLVFSAAQRILGDSGLAEEAAQATFIILIRKGKTLGPKTQFLIQRSTATKGITPVA